MERGSDPVTDRNRSRPAGPDGKAGIGTNNSFSAVSPQPRGGLLWQASVPCPAFPCATTLAIGGTVVNCNPQAEVIKIFEFTAVPKADEFRHDAMVVLLFKPFSHKADLRELGLG